MEKFVLPLITRAIHSSSEITGEYDTAGCGRDSSHHRRGGVVAPADFARTCIGRSDPTLRERILHIARAYRCNRAARRRV